MRPGKRGVLLRGLLKQLHGLLQLAPIEGQLAQVEQRGGKVRIEFQNSMEFFLRGLDLAKLVGEAVSLESDPLVASVLARFPGAQIVAVRGRDEGAASAELLGIHELQEHRRAPAARLVRAARMRWDAATWRWRRPGGPWRTACPG